jgi:D-3-phosphoglycerate dehydrogenase
MSRVLITESIADAGIQLLRDAGHDVDTREGLTGEELMTAIRDADALIVRSATKVTAEVLQAGENLSVVGRAGAGVDNVDVEAAKSLGIMVVNAPDSNSLSAAEHAFALMLALARHIPEASSSMREGKWERSKLGGVELNGKVLGIVGLGRIGTIVGQRGLAFGMHVIAYDPFIKEERARQVGVELVTLNEVMSTSDFISVHMPLNDETKGMIGEPELAMAKPNLRIVNAARGGMIVESALAKAVSEGKIAGAALDVFDEEPVDPDSPLLKTEGIITTPHLGASTAEAQDRAGVTIAEQLLLALQGDFVPYAVNIDAGQVSDVVRPYMSVAESLGRVLGSLTGGIPTKATIDCVGALAEHDVRILEISFLKGIFATTADFTQVSYVNAKSLAEERGLVVSTIVERETLDYVSAIRVSSGDHSAAATLFGERQEPRLIMIDNCKFDVSPADHMLVVRNDDRPGRLGAVSSAIGDAQVNIADLALSRDEKGGTALALVSLDERAPDELVQSLRDIDGVLDVRGIELGNL